MKTRQRQILRLCAILLCLWLLSAESYAQIPARPGLWQGIGRFTGLIVSGTVTATTFVGDGSHLTGISGTIGGDVTSATVIASGTTVPRSLGDRFADTTNIADFVINACSGTVDVAPFINTWSALSTSGTLTAPAGCWIKLLSPTTHYMNKNSFQWNSSLLDYRNATSAVSTSMLQLTQTAGFSNAAASYEHFFSNAKILGAGIGNTVTPTDLISITTHNFRMDGINADGARHCIAFGNNSYLIVLNGVWRNHCGGYTWFMPQGCSNCGENISFFGGGDGNSDNGWRMFNDNGDINMFSNSYDYPHNGTQGFVDGGRVTINDPHPEGAGSSATVAQFQVASRNGALLRIYGGTVLLVGTPGSSSTISVGALGRAEANGVFWQNIGGNNGCIKSGAGPFLIANSHYLNVSGLPKCVSTYDSLENRFIDGGFEGGDGNPRDLIWISSGHTPVVSTTTNANVSLTVNTNQARSGTRSLEISKLLSSGNSAVIRIAVPVTPGQTFLGNFYYGKFTTQTGSATLSLLFAKSRGLDSNGIPIIDASISIQSLGVTFTSATIPWTQFGPSTSATNGLRVPDNMNLAIWQINLTSTGVGTFNVDDNDGNLF